MSGSGKFNTGNTQGDAVVIELPFKQHFFWEYVN